MFATKELTNRLLSACYRLLTEEHGQNTFEYLLATGAISVVLIGALVVDFQSVSGPVHSLLNNLGFTCTVDPSSGTC